MDDLLKITKDSLGSIFSTIKAGIASTAQTIADGKDTAIIQAALSMNSQRIIKFRGFVSGATIQNIGVSYKSTSPLCSVVFDAMKKSFLLNRSGRYYSVWGDMNTFGVGSGIYVVPYDGVLYYCTSNSKYYILKDGTLAEATLSDMETLISSGYCNQYLKVDSDLWTTLTPFKILDDVVTAIYKGESANGYTKWLLFVYEDSETQTYSTYKAGNAKYIYGKYQYDPDTYNGPWELWLPSDLSSGAVEVDW